MIVANVHHGIMSYTYSMPRPHCPRDGGARIHRACLYTFCASWQLRKEYWGELYCAFPVIVYKLTIYVSVSTVMNESLADQKPQYPLQFLSHDKAE